MTLQVANTIREQLGNKALFMLGAKDFMGSEAERFLQFRIGRNSLGVTHIRITLTPCDTYTITAFRIRRSKGMLTSKTIDTRDGVYVDGLHRVLESVTGMYTRI